MISNLFAPLAMKVAGAIIAALLLALVVMWIGKMTVERQNAKLKVALAKADAALEVQNAAVEAMRTEAERRSREALEALAAAREANKGVASQIQKLRQSAAAPKGDACEISETLRNVEGL